MNIVNIVITNQIDGSLSVVSDTSLYCFEPVYNILKQNLQTYRNIPDENFLSQASEYDKSLPVLLILQDCFDIPKKIADIIFKISDDFEEHKSAGSVKFYDKENKTIIAKICFGDSPDEKTLTVDYMPIRNFNELRQRSQDEQMEIIIRHEDNGVQFASLDGVGISPFAEIAPGTIIYQGTIIKGKSSIGANTVLGPNTVIENSSIGENCVINSTQIYSSVIKDDIKIGPFCHIRPNCTINNGVKIGDFVEIKNSSVGENTHASHLTYIGDSGVGKNVTFGCGTVTVNYDGIKKARCTIKDGAFIGCNTNLVAPVTIGEDAFTAAGSTITSDVPADALAVARVREQRVIEHWVSRRKKKGG